VVTLDICSREEFDRVPYQIIIREPNNIEGHAEDSRDELRSYRYDMFKLLIAREV
jgi:hypothetical protein